MFLWLVIKQRGWIKSKEPVVLHLDLPLLYYLCGLGQVAFQMCMSKTEYLAL